MCKKANARYKRNFLKRFIVRLAFFILTPDCHDCGARDECEYNTMMTRYGGHDYGRKRED